jgi:hypothetical protein
MDQNHRRKRRDGGNSLIQTSDGGYAIAGSTNPSAQEKLMSMSSSWMPMVTSNGPKPSADQGTTDGALPHSDLRWRLRHRRRTPNPSAQEKDDVYVVKLDANGNLQWTKTIGGPGEEIGFSLIQTSDGGYAIAGSTNSFGAGGGCLCRQAGCQWKPPMDQNHRRTKEAGYSLIQTSDGGYAIAGFTQSFGAGGADVYVVKLDKNGNACCAVSQTSRVGSGGRLGSPTPSIGMGGTLTSPTPTTSSGGTLTNQCP